MERARNRALATLIALVAVLSAVAPTVDALAFGVHEHFATTSATNGAQGIASTGGTHSPTPHHCELSINPAERATTVALPLPMLLSEALAEPRLLSVFDTPFAPLPPPRA